MTTAPSTAQVAAVRSRRRALRKVRGGSGRRRTLGLHGTVAKLTRWGIDLHTGVLFGLVNQIALALLALALILQIVWGYRMWWQRGRGSAFGRRGHGEPAATP
ncbi:hypothetical protein AQI95_25910 [Streptomyces yokosukanensis]|uniref:PepSY domain-containing protein n=1 Tax=Streptomyces yokosukanensis TaxID=67386 RepID=A0A101P136_9ACTN|nr:hypothetical protein AQI95_25910 [Streptomyces yokosukanensis]